MAVAALVVPGAPAHATYGSDKTVSIEVWGQGVKLSGAYGTIAFDDGNAKYRYSIAVCWQASYTRPNLYASVNGGPRTTLSTSGTPVTIPQCLYTASLVTAEVTPGGTVGNVTLTVDGVRYNPPSSTYHTNSAVYDNPFN
ncbi:hypothetical protein DQ384_02030 [Sphaerisporangium album]|uniref:Uncharacterized protein n=1 Tax=Sphaerisporangium album TaxID=509200 RepID=A0A367FSM7_9ACTN|nr:hypothetical protein [Sphaerisporangium album]RCG33234.1 hypothetical protein DQ384_02030 [Sphaerisporangium album]